MSLYQEEVSRERIRQFQREFAHSKSIQEVADRIFDTDNPYYNPKVIFLPLSLAKVRFIEFMSSSQYGASKSSVEELSEVLVAWLDKDGRIYRNDFVRLWQMYSSGEYSITSLGFDNLTNVAVELKKITELPGFLPFYKDPMKQVRGNFIEPVVLSSCEYYIRKSMTANYLIVVVIFRVKYPISHFTATSNSEAIYRFNEITETPNMYDKDIGQLVNKLFNKYESIYHCSELVPWKPKPGEVIINP